MNNIEMTTFAFSTKLTAHQLNFAIRLGVLLHAGEHRFEGRPHVNGSLVVNSTDLSKPLTATYGHHSVIFEFVTRDRSMFDLIRTILDDKLLFQPASPIQAQGPQKAHGYERMSA